MEGLCSVPCPSGGLCELTASSPLCVVSQGIVVQRQKCVFPGRLWETFIALLQKIRWEEERERGRTRKLPHFNPALWMWERFVSGSAVGKQRCLWMLSELSWAGRNCWGPPVVSGVGTACPICVFPLTDRSVRGERCCTQPVCVFGAETSLFHTCTHANTQEQPICVSFHMDAHARVAFVACALKVSIIC